MGKRNHKNSKGNLIQDKRTRFEIESDKKTKRPDGGARESARYFKPDLERRFQMEGF